MQPIFNLLVGLYDVLGNDLGVAILAVTLIIRLLLAPLSHAALKSQVALQAIQPKMKELQEKHKGDREALARATMQLYREQKVNPLSSCLPTLIQLPFLIGIYSALQAAFHNGSFSLLYPFVPNPGTLRDVAFGFIPMSKPNLVLAVLAGAAQWWIMKMLTAQRPPPAAAKAAGKDEDMMAMVNKQMQFMMPVMTVVIGATLPAGLSLYWLATTLFQGVQQKLMLRRQLPASSSQPQADRT